jgi:hypothetical protein
MIVSIGGIQPAHFTDGNSFQTKRRAPEHELRAFFTSGAPSQNSRPITKTTALRKTSDDGANH